MWIYLLFLLIIAIIIFSPAFYVLWSWTTNNFSMKYLMQNLNYATDLDGFGGLPPIVNFDPENSVSNVNCQQGFFLGLEDIGHIEGAQKCESVCQSGDYDYKFIEQNGIFVNNKEIRGAWCLPKPISRCNLNTSNAFIGINRYECITKFPQLLGGSSGNQIIGCGPDNSFYDMLNEQTYSKYIPSNLVINDLDERMPNGEYRYQCKFNKNEYVSLENTGLGSRFDIEKNICTTFNSPGILDFKTLTCKCDNNFNVDNDPNKPCTDCTSGFGIIDEDRKQYGSRYGYSIGTNCVHPDRVTHSESLLSVMPCGLSKMLNFKENQKTSCLRTLVLATNTYTPEMLEKIEG